MLLTPAAPEDVTEALRQFREGTATKSDLKLLTKHYLALLERMSPGRSVEVRIPPFAAIQCIEGVRHTRGTPPAVIETDATTWISLASGALSWADAIAERRVRASGERADLTPYLPLV